MAGHQGPPRPLENRLNIAVTQIKSGRHVVEEDADWFTQLADMGSGCSWQVWNTRTCPQRPSSKDNTVGGWPIHGAVNNLSSASHIQADLGS